MSDVKISELPPYIGPNSPVGDIPISISGTTFKIDPSKLVNPGIKLFPIQAREAFLFMKGYQTPEGILTKNIGKGYEVNDIYLLFWEDGRVGLWQYVSDDPLNVEVNKEILTTTVNIL